MRVRPLTPADEDDALALYTELTNGPTPVLPGRFAGVVTHPGTTVFGAQVEGRIRSMATLHLLPNVTWSGAPYGLADNVITAASWRKRGLGAAVMAALLAHAQGAGAWKVMVQTGDARGAIGFYRACGFRDDGLSAMQIRWP